MDYSKLINTSFISLEELSPDYFGVNGFPVLDFKQPMLPYMLSLPSGVEITGLLVPRTDECFDKESLYLFMPSLLMKGPPDEEGSDIDQVIPVVYGRSPIIRISNINIDTMCPSYGEFELPYSKFVIENIEAVTGLARHKDTLPVREYLINRVKEIEEGLAAKKRQEEKTSNIMELTIDKSKSLSDTSATIHTIH